MPCLHGYASLENCPLCQLEITELKIRILNAELDTYEDIEPETDSVTQMIINRIEQINQAIREAGQKVLPSK